MGPEDPERGVVLIDVARRELERTLGPAAGIDAEERDELWLREPGAVFVTLTRGGELRGCVGSLVAVRSLIEDVRGNAVAAAQRDPRFAPVEPDELEDLEVEVTELTRPEPMHVIGEADALAQLRPGEDGIVLRFGERRATFLPQVWDSLPEPGDFLDQLKRKAGLPADFWDDELELERYRARKWTES